MEELINNIKGAFDLLTKVEDLNNKIHDMQSNVDSKLSDLYHYIENNNLNAAECCRIVKEIKKVREERRDINNAWEILRIFNNNPGKLQNEGSRKILFAELKKMEKNLNNSKYNNRVYKNKEIEDIIKGTYSDYKNVTYEALGGDNNDSKGIS